MSLAREMVAARRVTSSIAARTMDGGPSASIREIAADGATSPARHRTRIARITGDCTPSVRRLMASASKPVRLLMLCFFGTTCATPTRISYTHINTERPDMAARKSSGSRRKYGKAASKRVESAMRRRKKGTLKSGRSGRTVKSRKQAIAIGLSEARKKGAKVPRKRGG
jgi:Family of unknown function (DUF6496)